MGKDTTTRALSCAALLALAAVHPAVAWAADAHVQQDLEQAEQALENLDYDAANQAATRIVEEHGLTHDQIVRAYRLLGITSAVLDKRSAARDAFQQLLTFDPTYVSDPNLGPKVRSPLMEARGFMRAQPSQPGVEVSVVLRPNEAGTIRVTTRDPTHVARRVTVGFRWGSDAPFTTARLPVSDGASTSVPPPPTGTTRLDYYVQAFDDRDDAVFESGTPATPKSTTLDAAAAGSSGAAPDGASALRAARSTPEEHPHSIFASPIFWTITAVVLAGAGTGVYFAARKPGDATSATLLPSFKCGGGSTPGSC